MSKDAPYVSVIMSVYNDNVEHLCSAIDSILGQTFVNYEFIIINDGASNEVREVIDRYEFADPRIKTAENKINLGLTKSLNKAISLAQGVYIARMDADDIAIPQRFERQIQFLDNHPDHAMVGTAFEEIVNGIRIKQRLPLLLENSVIKKQIMKFNPFCHASVMLRRDVLLSVGGYDESFKFAQDYDMWLRLSERYKVANLPEVLMLRRMDNNISTKSERRQKLFAAKAQFKSILRRTYPLYAVIYSLRPVIVAFAPRVVLRAIRKLKYGEVY